MRTLHISVWVKRAEVLHRMRTAMLAVLAVASGLLPAGAIAAVMYTADLALGVTALSARARHRGRR